VLTVLCVGTTCDTLEMHRHYYELTIAVFKINVFWIQHCIFQPAAPYTAKDHGVSIFKAMQFNMNSPPPPKKVCYTDMVNAGIQWKERVSILYRC